MSYEKQNFESGLTEVEKVLSLTLFQNAKVLFDLQERAARKILSVTKNGGDIKSWKIILCCLMDL